MMCTVPPNMAVLAAKRPSLGFRAALYNPLGPLEVLHPASKALVNEGASSNLVHFHTELF